MRSRHYPVENVIHLLGRKGHLQSVESYDTKRQEKRNILRIHARLANPTLFYYHTRIWSLAMVISWVCWTSFHKTGPAYMPITIGVGCSVNDRTNQPRRLCSLEKAWSLVAMPAMAATAATAAMPTTTMIGVRENVAEHSLGWVGRCFQEPTSKTPNLTMILWSSTR